MQKKNLFSLGLAVLMCLTMAQAYANSTIYTDELGRMHFLGKDPGAKTLQKIEEYDNPAQKDVTNIIYKNDKQNLEQKETKVNAKKVKKEKKERRERFERTEDSDRSGKVFSESLNPNVNQKMFWQIW